MRMSIWMMWVVIGTCIALPGCDKETPKPAPGKETPAPAKPEVSSDKPAPSAPEAPKPADAAAPVPAPEKGAAEAGRWQGDGIAWTTPEGWTTTAGDGFRYATIAREGVQIAVSRFPGDVGGNVANINRWRMQVGLPAVDAAEAEKLLAKIKTRDGEALIVDLSGEGTNQRLVAVIIPDVANQRTWFLRLSGEAKTIEPHIPTLRQVVESIKLVGPAA